MKKQEITETKQLIKETQEMVDKLRKGGSARGYAFSDLHKKLFGKPFTSSSCGKCARDAVRKMEAKLEELRASLPKPKPRKKKEETAKDE